MATAKRLWIALVAFLIAVGMVAIPTASAQAADYYAKDDKVTEKFYFYADPFDRSLGSSLRKEDLRKNGTYMYGSQEDVTDRYKPKYYGIEPFGNDPLGYDVWLKFDYKGKHGLAETTVVPKKGYFLRDLGCFADVCVPDYSYVATATGSDSFAYRVKDKNGVWHDATVSGIRNVNVQNVEATSVVNGVRFYNPNPFKVRVHVGTKGFYPYEDWITIAAKSSKTFKTNHKYVKESFVGSTVDYRTEFENLPAVTFRTKVLKPKSKPTVKVYKKGASVRVYAVGSTKKTSYFTIRVKKAGATKYTTIKRTVKRGSSRTINLKLTKGSTVKVNARVKGKGGYKSLLKKRV